MRMHDLRHDEFHGPCVLLPLRSRRASAVKECRTGCGRGCLESAIATWLSLGECSSKVFGLKFGFGPLSDCSCRKQS
jgi:hypothetical protein